MFPQGFLGTRADLLIDIVVCSFVVIIPVLLWSWGKARSGQWATHKAVQVTLAIALGVIVLIFEWDLRTQGGIFALTAASKYAGTAALNFWIWFHLLCSVTASITWLGLVVASLFKFPKPPRPNEFAARHRFWGRIAMTAMLLAAVTSVPLYYYGFMG